MVNIKMIIIMIITTIVVIIIMIITIIITIIVSKVHAWYFSTNNFTVLKLQLHYAFISTGKIIYLC